MARLPIPGQDEGTWGDILNQYLLTSLTSSGGIQPGAISAAGGQLTSAKGQPDGYASLDGTGNVPLDQLGNVSGGSPQTLMLSYNGNGPVDVSVLLPADYDSSVGGSIFAILPESLTGFDTELTCTINVNGSGVIQTIIAVVGENIVSFGPAGEGLPLYVGGLVIANTNGAPGNTIGGVNAYQSMIVADEDGSLWVCTTSYDPSGPTDAVWVQIEPGGGGTNPFSQSFSEGGFTAINTIEAGDPFDAGVPAAINSSSVIDDGGSGAGAGFTTFSSLQSVDSAQVTIEGLAENQAGDTAQLGGVVSATTADGGVASYIELRSHSATRDTGDQVVMIATSLLGDTAMSAVQVASSALASVPEEGNTAIYAGTTSGVPTPNEGFNLDAGQVFPDPTTGATGLWIVDQAGDPQFVGGGGGGGGGGGVPVVVQVAGGATYTPANPYEMDIYDLNDGESVTINLPAEPQDGQTIIFAQNINYNNYGSDFGQLTVNPGSDDATINGDSSLVVPVSKAYGEYTPSSVTFTLTYIAGQQEWRIVDGTILPTSHPNYGILLQSSARTSEGSNGDYSTVISVSGSAGNDGSRGDTYTSSLTPQGVVTNPQPLGVTIHSGVAQQPTSNGIDQVLYLDVDYAPSSGASAGCLIELSPDNSTWTTLGNPGIPANGPTLTMNHSVRVPANYWVRVTLTNATVTNATLF